MASTRNHAEYSHGLDTGRMEMSEMYSYKLLEPVNKQINPYNVKLCSVAFCGQFRSRSDLD